MNKVFEKILKRLEETKDIAHDDSLAEIVSTRIWNKAIHRAKQVVQEVEEEYNGGWIPCSERLPEDSVEVLVCKQSGILDFDMYEYQYEDWKFNSKNHKNTVIAWQPLPEPYKESDA